MCSFTAMEFGVTETRGVKCTSQNSKNLERPYRKDLNVSLNNSEISASVNYTNPSNVRGPYIL